MGKILEEDDPLVEMENKKITVKGSLNRIRDFIYIDDVVKIWVKSLNDNIYNQTINLSTGEPTSVKKLLSERPNIKGITVPGMPAGVNVPGMEVSQERAEFEVLAVNNDGSTFVWKQYE